MKTKLERVQLQNKRLDSKLKKLKFKINEKANAIAKTRLDEANNRMRWAGERAQCHLEQIGILMRDNKALKHQLLLKNVEIEYLQGRKS